MMKLALIIFLSIIQFGSFAELPYTICDFDLDLAEEYLSDKCKDIKETDENLYLLAKHESKVFNDLQRILEGQLKDIEENKVEEKAVWKRRLQLYHQKNLYKCNDKQEQPSAKDFYNCLIAKRLEMIEELNNDKFSF